MKTPQFLRGVVATTNRRPVPGYEGLYSVYSDGRVYSHKRTLMRKDGVPKTCGGRFLTRNVGNHGYERVTLCKDGIQSEMLVHHIVARAFHGKCPEGMEVCHRDGNKLHNHFDNLLYGTSQDNADHMLEHGTECSGERSSSAILTWKQVRRIRKLYTVGGRWSQRDLADRYGVHQTTIQDVLKEITWKPERDPMYKAAA